MKVISAALFLSVITHPVEAVDLILGHFEYQVDYGLNPEDPDQGWATSISYDLDGSFADSEGIVRLGLSDVRLLAAPSTGVVTANPPTGFGTANEKLWALSQNNISGQLFLGWRAIYPQGLFQANVNGNYTPNPLGSISSQLLSVTGTGPQRSGDFAMWTSSGFGSLEFHFNSSDGIDSADLLNPLPAGAHSHYNWGFTKPGTYAVTFRNEGRLNPQHGGAQTSSEATLNFVVPHDGILRGEGHWRLGDGRENSPQVALLDRQNQVDYAADQVVLITNDGRFNVSLADSNEASLGLVGLSEVDPITFPNDETITIELLAASGPGPVSLSNDQGFSLFEFEASGIYRVTLRARQGEMIGEPFVLTFLHELEADYSYEAWAESFERTHQLPTGSLTDPTADHDHDCLSNGLEFLLFWHGLDPAKQDSHLLPKPRFVDGQAQIEFLRDLKKDDFSTTSLELAAAYSEDLQAPWKPWRRLFSEGTADGFYEDGAELGNETSAIMRRRLVVPEASPNFGFFRFEQRSRN